MNETYHYAVERKYRDYAIDKYIGAGNPVATFTVERGHANGAERHVVTDTAIIEIYNIRTNKLITRLVARPAQLQRLYNGKCPRNLINLAYDHQRAGYNEI